MDRIEPDMFRPLGSVAADIVARVANQTENAFFADGIYFGMSDVAYHDDPAIGSTGIKDLLTSPPDYWWNSPMNPARPEDEETPAKVFGRAVHACILEGRAALEARYGEQTAPGNVKAGKDQIEAIKAMGKTPIKSKDWHRIIGAEGFIRMNETLRDAFTGGVAEVSVFWTGDNGIRRKVRFDYLKPGAIVDLKSIRNPLSKPFLKACTDRIAEHDHIISARYYMDGRRQMARLVSQGRVYGDCPLGIDWLRAVAAVRVFAFVLVFWQAEGAPISAGFKLSPENPALDDAAAQIEAAIRNYQAFMREFGPSRAWVPATPLEEIDATELPVWWQIRKRA